MKKSLYMTVAAIAVLSSCSGDDAILDENGQNEMPMTITVAMEDFDGPTSRTTLNTSTLQPEWVEGELIRLVNQYNDAYYKATSSGPTSTFTCKSGTTPGSNIYIFYPSTMYDDSSKKILLPASYTYSSGKFGMPMYAFVASENDINTIQMKNLCAVLAITVPSSQVSKVYGIEVSSDQQLNGQLRRIDYSTGKITFASATLTDDNKKVKLDGTINISESVTFYLPIPPGTHNPLTIKVYTDNKKTQYKQMTTTKSGGVTVERNKIYPVTFADHVPTIQPNTDTKVFDGLFSVSATKQVRFTKGNLYWTGSAYAFEQNQTDYPTSWSSSHVGHFYFSKTASVTYAQTYSDASAAANDTYCFNENSKLTIGSYQYYLLTDDEWGYVTERRNNASNLLKHYETVTNGSNSYFPCTLIAPDNFDTSKWKSSGSYSLLELQNLGIVCLPPAGYRDGATITGGNNSGWYWTTGGDESSTASAYYFLYNKTNNNSGYGFADSNRNMAKSIRLVSDVVKK